MPTIQDLLREGIVGFANEQPKPRSHFQKGFLSALLCVASADPTIRETPEFKEALRLSMAQVECILRPVYGRHFADHMINRVGDRMVTWQGNIAKIKNIESPLDPNPV